MSMNVKGVTFILVDGRRDIANGREYRCMGWFPANTLLPVCLLQDYNRRVAQKERLATLRKRARPSEEVELVEATVGGARKKV